MKMKILSILSAILVVSGLSILAFAESPDSGREEPVSMEEKHPKVLLEDVVKEFDYLIGRIGHHAIAVGDEVYTQPHVYISFHVIQMRAAGWDTDFDEVATVSGASALFAYEHGTFDPKYAHHLIGMDDRITEATGFGYEWVDFSGIDEAWAIIKESVDSGRSVKGWFWENILFAGYQDADKPEDRKVFAISDGPGTFAEWWSWEKLDKEYIKLVTGWGATGLGRYTERVSARPTNEVALRVIKDLVGWSINPPEKIVKKYPKATFGLAGIELYAKNCADMEKFEDFGACHGMNPQWPIRNSTSVYLKKLAEAKVFSEEINSQLLKAAEEYRAAYIYWKQFYNHLSYGGWEGWGKIKEHRMAGAEGVQKALDHEKLAIDKLKIVLEKANTPKEKKVVIDDVDRYRVWGARFEGVRVIMSYHGEKYSPEYIQGISGAAFRMDGICPCAPTVGNMMETHDLPELLGYETDYVYLDKEGVDKKTPVDDIIERVKEEIRAGRPVLAWNAFSTAEWDVVCGFDDEKKQFIGRGTNLGVDSYAVADERRFSEWIPDPGPIVIFIKDKVDEFDAREAEIASLKEAVKHSRTIKEIPADGKWVFLEGLQCYDRWVNDFQSDPNRKRKLGDSYCLSVYRTTHRAASVFMKELIPKYPEAKENLEKASEYFVAEANTLDQCDGLIGYKVPEVPDADRNVKTAKLLKQARDNYANAINEIEEALKKIER